MDDLGYERFCCRMYITASLPVNNRYNELIKGVKVMKTMRIPTIASTGRITRDIRDVSPDIIQASTSVEKTRTVSSYNLYDILTKIIQQTSQVAGDLHNDILQEITMVLDSNKQDLSIRVETENDLDFCLRAKFPIVDTIVTGNQDNIDEKIEDAVSYVADVVAMNYL